MFSIKETKARKKSYESDNTLFIFSTGLMYWKQIENENLKSRTKASKRKKNQWQKNQRLQFYTSMDICKFLKRKTTSSDNSVSSKSAAKI